LYQQLHENIQNVTIITIFNSVEGEGILREEEAEVGLYSVYRDDEDDPDDVELETG